MARTKKALTPEALKKACDDEKNGVFEISEFINVEDKKLLLETNVEWNDTSDALQINVLLSINSLKELGYKNLGDDKQIKMFDFIINVPEIGIEAIRSIKDIKVYVEESIKSNKHLWNNEDDEIMMSDIDNYLVSNGVKPIR